MTSTLVDAGSLPRCPTSSGTLQPDRRGLHSGWTLNFGQAYLTLARAHNNFLDLHDL